MGGIPVELHHPFGWLFPNPAGGLQLLQRSTEASEKNRRQTRWPPNPQALLVDQTSYFFKKSRWNEGKVQLRIFSRVLSRYHMMKSCKHTLHCYWLLLVTIGIYPIKTCSQSPKKNPGTNNQMQPIPINGSTVESLERTPVTNFFLAQLRQICITSSPHGKRLALRWKMWAHVLPECEKSQSKSWQKITSYKMKSMGCKEKRPFQLHSTDFISGWLVFQPIPALPYIFRSFLQEWHTTIFRAKTALERCYLPWPPKKIKIPCLACKKNCQSILYQPSSHEHQFIRLFRCSHRFEAVKAEVCI